jgi:hypothetical protein
MRNKTIFRLCGAGLLALGLPTLFTAQWGVLWQPGTAEYLGWGQLYILRPGMYLTGAVATAFGLWMLWLRWTIAGRVLRGWVEDVRHDRALDEQYGADPDWLPRRWQDDLRALWWRRGCMVGRHDPRALWHSDGGEDGPRGTTCGDCGVRISLENVTAPLIPVTLERRPWSSANMDDCFNCGQPIAEHEGGEYDDECPRLAPTRSDPTRDGRPWSDKEA